MKNHSVLHGKVIRVMRSNRDPIARSSGIGNVFVKNLDESVDNNKLQTLFKEYGNILSCKVVVSEDGKSKGYGFVQFENAAEATAAIENLHNTSFEGKELYVANFVKKSDRTSYGPDGIFTNLYFKNLDMDMNEELLMEKFSNFGNIVSLVISKDENGNSKGFGFVNFENSDDAKRAMESMNGSELGSKILFVARAQKKAEREKLLRRHFEEIRKARILKYQACNVYIKNIADEVDEGELREQFSQCGTIKSAKLMRDEKGRSKGFGFVCYSASYEADRAVALLNGVMICGKPLYVAIAQKKDDRLQHLQQHFSRVAEQAVHPTVLSSGFPHYYATPQATSTPGWMYHPIIMRPGWSVAAPTPFQPAAQYPVMSTNPRPPNSWPSRGRGIGQFFPEPNQRAGRARYGRNHHSRSRELNRDTTAVPPNPAESNGMGSLSSMLAAASPHEQKQMLGNRLYPLVHRIQPDLASKITGMLLEMDNAEVLVLLESPDYLADRVSNAEAVLEAYNAADPDQEAPHQGVLQEQLGEGSQEAPEEA